MLAPKLASLVSGSPTCSAEPSTRPRAKQTDKKRNSAKQSDADLCAKLLAQISALSVGGYVGGLNFCVCSVTVFIFLLLERGAFLFFIQLFSAFFDLNILVRQFYGLFLLIKSIFCGTIIINKVKGV